MWTTSYHIRKSDTTLYMLLNLSTFMRRETLPHTLLQKPFIYMNSFILK